MSSSRRIWGWRFFFFRVVEFPIIYKQNFRVLLRPATLTRPALWAQNGIFYIYLFNFKIDLSKIDVRKSYGLDKQVVKISIFRDLYAHVFKNSLFFYTYPLNLRFLTSVLKFTFIFIQNRRNYKRKKYICRIFAGPRLVMCRFISQKSDLVNLFL